MLDADAALFRFAGQCAGVCQNVYGYHGSGISISDSDQRRRASGEGGRKPSQCDALQFIRGADQYGARSAVYFWISYGNGGCCAGNDHWTDFFRNPDYPVSAPLQKRTADSGASSTTENICKHDYLIGGGGIFQSACDAGGADRVK